MPMIKAYWVQEKEVTEKIISLLASGRTSRGSTGIMIEVNSDCMGVILHDTLSKRTLESYLRNHGHTACHHAIEHEL